MIKVTGLSWLGIGADDFTETLAFFTDVLGLEPAAVDARGVAILKAGPGQVVEIFGPGTGGYARTRPPVVAFEVEDVEAAVATLRRRGVPLLGETGRWNGFVWQFFEAPSGQVFAVKKTPPDGWEDQ